jgi:anti-sigma B factor antagonist
LTQHPLTVEIRPDVSTATVVLVGELDLGSADTLRVCLEQLNRDVEELVVDLAGLRFLDSTGISLLVQTQQTYRDRTPPGRVVLRHPQGHVRKVLEVSGVDQVLTVVA